MATETGTDPNQERDDERNRGTDHPALSEADAFGTKLNPVRETPVPFGNLGDGGGRQG